MARSMNGQTNFTVNQMNAANVMTCANRVRLMFMTCSSLLAESGGQRIGEGEEHGDAQADDERRVDQAEQQEHLALERVGELGLARGRLEEAAAHDAHADAGAGGSQAD